jgi:kinetochore protein Spc7/SPC105
VHRQLQLSRCASVLTMAAEFDKENIADGLLASSNHKSDAPSPKKAKKSRSLSMGPGALNVPLKEDAGNRRKVGLPLLTRSLSC